MFNNTDMDKAHMFLRYLARATKEATREVEISPRLSDRITKLSKRLDKFIQLQETKKLATASKEDIKAMLESDLARVKNVLIQAKKEKLPVVLQILISPLLDLSRSLKKYVKYENKDSFPNPLADWFIELYLQSEFNLHSSPEISPFWSNFLFNWPPTYFLFGENDRFRSDSEVFYTKLTQFGFWAHKSVFKKENHSVFWQKMNVLETVSAQLQMGLFLTKIPRQNFSFLLADDEPIDLEKKHQHCFQKKN